MIVLGVSGGHDANWCVLRDGRLIGAFEKERLTRVRHDRGEVMSLIPLTLQRLGIKPADIDLVATSEPVHRGTESGLRTLAGQRYQRPDQWTHQTVECFGRVLPCVSVPHHLCHAAYARYSSPFAADTAVLTWDGGGDFYTEDAYTSTSVSYWDASGLHWLERVDNSDFGSLWFTYSRAIFGDGDHAGKLMGLSAHGTDSLLDRAVEHFVRPVRGLLDGAVTVKNCWPDYEAPPFLDGPTPWPDRRAKDVARAVQHVTDLAGLSLARQVREVTGARYLALSGGVALNGYLNTLVRREAGFDDVFVPPAVNDGGISAGAALFAYHGVLGVDWQPGSDTAWEFNGCAFSAEETQAAITAAGLTSERVSRSHAEHVVADALSEGLVVGWCEGAGEHGPRALGHRSILALPDRAETRDRINREVKFRESFRPLAPAVLADAAADYYDIEFESPWMMYIVPVTSKGSAVAPAAVHTDGTARVQTVGPDAPLAGILTLVGDATGVPIVLNTSLNVRTPIVNGPQDALDAFRDASLDLLYVNGHLVRGGAR